MKQDDTLWKSILEDLIVHFLRFFLEEADQLLDLTKKVEFLDKEMAQISKRDKQGPPKYVDKLVKVFTKEGKEEWVLIHIEVQGYKDVAFEERMYIYYYRIFDLYKKRIAAIVILTDKSKTYHPTQYHRKFLGTEITFRFNTYKIIDQDAEALNRSKNPFAFVILTALLALKKQKQLKANDEEGMLKLKIALARKLLAQSFPKPVIRGLYHFIRNYVVFEKDENNLKFDNTINSITDKNKTMGIVELLRERQMNALREELSVKFREEYMVKGREEGVKKGIKEGIEKGKAEFVTNLLSAQKFTISEIANFAGVTEAFVRKIKKPLK